MTADFTVRGLQANASGNLYANVEQPNFATGEIQSAQVRVADFVGGPSDAIRSLKRRNVLIIGKDAVAKLQERVEGLRYYAPTNIAERVGWNGISAFGLPDATLIAADPGEVITTFESHPLKCSVKGTLKGWQDGVATPLAGQLIALFALMLSFVAPLLRLTDRVGGFGFEIVGAKGFGKSTVVYLASSVLGGATQGDDGHYWVGLDTTINALEDTMEAHSDLPIIFDEAGLLAAGAPVKERAEIYKALVFKLCSGEQKDRMGADKKPGTRHVFFVSANDSLSDLTDQASESTRAAGDRLLTIRLPQREYRIFDHLPEGFAGSTEYAKALVDAANEHHGHPIRVYLQALVKARVRNEQKLRSWVAKRVRQFIAQTGISSNDGSAYRIAEAFALVFAAGKLAQRFKVLPRALDVETAAIETYRLHIASREEPIPFAVRLHALADSDATYTIFDREAKRSKAELEAIKSALAVRQRRRSGEQLLISPDRILEAFPDWHTLKKKGDVRDLIEMEVGIKETKLAKKAFLASGLKRQRLIVFRLPPLNREEASPR